VIVDELKDLMSKSAPTAVTTTDDSRISSTCTNFNGGLVEYILYDVQFAAISVPDVDDVTSFTWTIDGKEVSSSSPVFIILSYYISKPGPVKVCYEASSSCGVFTDCVTINFTGN
ncbi:MAG: hypothetical protein AAGA66_14590, partial [Bacteroidota bacterium]